MGSSAGSAGSAGSLIVVLGSVEAVQGDENPPGSRSSSLEIGKPAHLPQIAKAAASSHVFEGIGNCLPQVLTVDDIGSYTCRAKEQPLSHGGIDFTPVQSALLSMP